MTVHKKQTPNSGTLVDKICLILPKQKWTKLGHDPGKLINLIN